VDTIEYIQVVDADTHVIEPPDLWTSRAPSSLRSAVPRVVWSEERQEDWWMMGDLPLTSASKYAMAGWREYPPDHPRRWADVNVNTYDARERLTLMDDYGIYTQLLYPNVAVFGGHDLMKTDAALRLACVKIYNDWQTEWSGEAPDRLIPITSLPLWDRDASIAEVERCAAMGHRGVIFSQEPKYMGLPALDNHHWDPVWATAQEAHMPVNFHIATGDMTIGSSRMSPHNGIRANHAGGGMAYCLENARTIAKLISSGICHRFPDLDFVTVESGVGWIPFALASMDWAWKNHGVTDEHPEYDLLPSEYFKRQIYGMFWFEEATALSAIDILGPDNFMYETDFPHPTSMSPGPKSSAIRPDDFIRKVIGTLPPDTQRKVLHDNAARVYHL
jgi:predicted TIM-barrel fold metal-dependent hydrolase